MLNEGKKTGVVVTFLASSDREDKNEYEMLDGGREYKFHSRSWARGLRSELARLGYSHKEEIYRSRLNEI